MDDRVALVLARELFLALDQRLGVGRDLLASLRPAGHRLRPMQPRQRLDDRLQRGLHVALRGEVERIVTAHEHGVGADLHHARLGDGAVHALAADEEQQIGLQARRLLEVLGDGIHAAVERMAVGEVHEDLARGEDGRVQELGQTHRLRRRATAPHVITEHQHRALRGAESPRDRLDGLRTRRRRRLDPVARALADLRLEPLAIEQRRADRQVHRARRRRAGLAQRARGGHGNGLRIRHHGVGGPRVLGERAHRLRLAQAGVRGEAAEILQLGGPVAGDDDQRRAGVLSVEQLPRQLIGTAHDMSDDDADLAADPVVAVGHRGHEPLVLADHEPVLLGLGQRREDPRLRGAGIREEVFDPRVLEGLQQQHAAGAGDRLAHVNLTVVRGRPGPEADVV